MTATYSVAALSLTWEPAVYVQFQILLLLLCQATLKLHDNGRGISFEAQCISKKGTRLVKLMQNKCTNYILEIIIVTISNQYTHTALPLAIVPHWITDTIAIDMSTSKANNTHRQYLTLVGIWPWFGNWGLRLEVLRSTSPHLLFTTCWNITNYWCKNVEQ